MPGYIVFLGMLAYHIHIDEEEEKIGSHRNGSQLTISYLAVINISKYIFQYVSYLL